MRLRHTVEYTATIGYAVVEGAALCVLAVLTAQLPLRSYAFGARYMLLLYGLCTLALPVWATVYQERQWRRTTPTGAPDIPIARHQPDAALSLAPGETVRLRSVPLRWQEKWQVGIVTGLMLLVGLDAFVLYWEPSIIRQVESLIYGGFHALRLVGASQLVAPEVTSISTAQWALAVGPLLVGLFFLLGMIVTRGAVFRETLTADDRGLTWTSPLWRTRFIAWGDVQRFVARIGQPAYCVFGAQEAISFHAPQALGAATPATPPEKTITPLSQAHKRSKLAKEAYDALALRLASTIVARGGKPLLLGNGPNYTAEDIKDAPVANARMFRRVTPPNNGRLPDSESVLRIRASKWLFVRRSFIGGLFLPAFGALLLLILAPDTIFTPAFLTLTNAIAYAAGGALFWLMGVVVISVFRAQAFRDALPTVQTHAKQLVIRGYNEKVVARVDWGDVSVWAVQRPSQLDISRLDSAADGPLATTSDAWRFILLTNDGKLLTWDEPADAELDDAQLATPEARRAAYREQAGALHALIAARTGLPLRELPPPA